MSMVTVNKAFVEGLARKATSRGCTMSYVRGEDGKQRQRLECRYVAGGQEMTIGETLDGQADLAAAARILGATVATEK